MAISETQSLFGDPEDPDPHADKTHLVVSTAIAMIILANIAVVLRFVSRRVIHVPFLVDDWLMLAALPFAVCLPAIDIFGAVDGYFGRHLLVAPVPLDYLVIFLKGVYVFDIAYNFAIALTKLSMLAIYWRIFHAKSFKLPLLITAGATIAWLISCTLVAILSCMPVPGFWDKTIEATCINNFAFYIGQAVCNIILDVALLVIPISRVFKLEISASQKFAVSGIFLIGAFTTLASALRLNELIRSLFVGFQDPPYELVGSSVWSVLEANLSIICACLPTMRPLLRLAMHGSPFPTASGNSRGASNGNSRGGNRISAYNLSDTRAKSQVVNGGGVAASNWPLPKRMSGVASPTRLSFRSSRFGDGHMSPVDRPTQIPTEGAGGRPLVYTPHSFTTNRYQSLTPVEERQRMGEDIEMGERGTRNGDGDGSRGHGSGDVGVAIGTAYDEVSQYGGSAGTAETDTVKHLEETRPVDGF